MSDELNPHEEPTVTAGGMSADDLNAPNKDSRMWAMFCHLSGLVGFVIPFGNIVGPLVLWMMKKDESAFINDQGKEALNFQISWSIYMVIAAILIILLVGILLLPVLAIGGLILMIVGGVQANDGKIYRYPGIFRLVN